jgi:putative transposase
LTPTTLRQLHHVVFALLCIPNRATMRGLSRWSERGGSYRTLQRFYQTSLAWAKLHWLLVTTHLLGSSGPYLLAGDEVVVSKSGKQTHGVGRFYSSLDKRPIPSVSFLTLSLIDVEQRQSYPLQIEQLLPKTTEAAPADPPPKRGPGRPKGRKNYEKPAPTLSPLMQTLQTMLKATTQRIGDRLEIKHVVLDGKYGNYPGTWTVRDADLHIISKMRSDAALVYPYDGPKPNRGPTSRYGQAVDYAQLPDDMRVSTETTATHRIDTYHLHVYHRDYPDMLNVAVVVKTRLSDNQRGHVVLFSTDLDLRPAQIVDYYALRFQIEFNFRDAKQHWGLEDFMNVTPQAVTNAANLAFFMVNLAAILRQQSDTDDLSVRDLKAAFRAQRYLSETIKLLPHPPDATLVSRIRRRLTRFGAIRPPNDDVPAA